MKLLEEMGPSDKGCVAFLFFVVAPLWAMILLTWLFIHLINKY